MKQEFMIEEEEVFMKSLLKHRNPQEIILFLEELKLRIKNHFHLLMERHIADKLDYDVSIRAIESNIKELTEIIEKI